MSKVTKKCPYCNSEYQTYDGWDDVLKNGFQECCDKCKEIQELHDFIKNYSDNHRQKEDFNPIYEKNMVKDAYQPVAGVTIYSSNFYKTGYRVNNRSKFVEEIIEKIDYVRRLLSMEVSAQFEILDSIYENKNIFWDESGNLIMYVHNASFEYIVIKLKELLSGSESKYSIEKLKNIFKNNKRRIFEQEVYEVFNYSNGDSFETKYEPFPIIEYLDKINILLNEYSDSINAISDFRDNQFAHIGKIKDKKSSSYLSYVNIKRIYNMLKMIYDGFLFSIAPDKFATLFVDHNIWFSHLDQVVKEYRCNHPRKDK